MHDPFGYDVFVLAVTCSYNNSDCLLQASVQTVSSAQVIHHVIIFKESLLLRDVDLFDLPILSLT